MVNRNLSLNPMLIEKLIKPLCLISPEALKMIPQKVQKDILEYQKIEAELQYIVQQKYQLQAKINEAENAINLLHDQPADAVIYKAVGTVMVKGLNKESVEKDLIDLKETQSLRLKSIEKQENALKERFETLEKNINNALKEMGLAQSPKNNENIDDTDEYN